MNTVVRRNMSKSTSDFLSAIDRLPELHQRLSKVIILNEDGIGLMEKWDRSNVFIYADPPYEQSTRASTRYDVDMNSDEHNKFLETCVKSKAKLLISGYDCELYEILTNNGFQKIQFEVASIGGNRKPKIKIETLWKNY